ncbi:hypothetical protein CR513_22459, partial [Mucuna pruriens]
MEFRPKSIFICATSSHSHPHTHGGAQYFRGVSLDRGGASQELGSQSLTSSRLFETESSPTLLRPSLRLAKIVSDPSLPRPDRISLCREQVGILHLAFSTHYDRKPYQIATVAEDISSFVSFSSITNDSDSFEYNGANIFVKPDGAMKDWLYL